MARTEPFNKYLNEYENWFDEHEYVYKSELEAVRYFIPENKNGIEIGIGSGRFALPFGIQEGVEPSREMRHFAGKKNLKVYNGIAENLPLPDNSYDFALMVTTICFIDDSRKSFSEIKRILKNDGSFIIGLVDKESSLGKKYEEMKEQNKFYRFATFYSTDEILNLLKESGFTDIEVVQTIFGNLNEINTVQSLKEGYGEGGFVVIKSIANKSNIEES